MNLDLDCNCVNPWLDLLLNTVEEKLDVSDMDKSKVYKIIHHALVSIQNNPTQVKFRKLKIDKLKEKFEKPIMVMAILSLCGFVPNKHNKSRLILPSTIDVKQIGFFQESLSTVCDDYCVMIAEIRQVCLEMSQIYKFYFCWIGKYSKYIETHKWSHDDNPMPNENILNQSNNHYYDGNSDMKWQSSNDTKTDNESKSETAMCMTPRSPLSMENNDIQKIKHVDNDQGNINKEMNGLNININGSVEMVQDIIDPIICAMTMYCLSIIDKPQQLYQHLVSFYQKLLHLLGIVYHFDKIKCKMVASNSNSLHSMKKMKIMTMLKLEDLTWKCWHCIYDENSMLMDIACKKCGYGVNPHFIFIENECKQHDVRLSIGICFTESRLPSRNDTKQNGSNGNSNGIDNTINSNSGTNNHEKFSLMWLSNNPTAIKIVVNGTYSIYSNQGDLNIQQLKQIIFNVLIWDVFGNQRYSNRYKLDDFEFTSKCKGLCQLSNDDIIPFPGGIVASQKYGTFEPHTYYLVNNDHFTMKIGFRDEYKRRYGSSLCCNDYCCLSKLSGIMRNQSENGKANEKDDFESTLEKKIFFDNNDKNCSLKCNGNNYKNDSHNGYGLHLLHCPYLNPMNGNMLNWTDTIHHLTQKIHWDDTYCTQPCCLGTNNHDNDKKTDSNEYGNQNGCMSLYRLQIGNFDSLLEDVVHLLWYYHKPRKCLFGSNTLFEYSNASSKLFKPNDTYSIISKNTSYILKQCQNNYKLGLNATESKNDSNEIGLKSNWKVHFDSIFEKFDLFHDRLNEKFFCQMEDDNLIILLLLQEFIRNGYETDWMPCTKNSIIFSLKDGDLNTLTFYLARQHFKIFDLLLTRMIHPIHKKMGMILKRSQMLSLLLYTNGQCRDDFNKNVCFSRYNNYYFGSKKASKWFIFDYLLKNSIKLLHERENKDCLMHVCIPDSTIDVNKLKNHCSNNISPKMSKIAFDEYSLFGLYPKTLPQNNTPNDKSDDSVYIYLHGYTSATTSLTNINKNWNWKENGIVYSGKQNEMMQLNDQIQLQIFGNDCYNYCCDVSWISMYANEKEILITPGLVLKIKKENMY